MYIEKAKELNMKAIAFSSHGNCYNWISKKQKCDKEGIKYIHACEVYITESLEEKVRDNYHTVIISRNWEGVKELNSLISKANNKNDGHFYYDPRITMDELIATSDNLLVTTACLASPLYKGKDKPIYNKYLNFLIKNKHRVFLEFQYHFASQQKDHNLNLFNLHKKYGLNIIAGTDTHNLNSELADARRILQLSKNIKYAEEESFDLNLKSYDELVNAFKAQNVLPEKIYLQAIENTNQLLNLVEDFELDTTNKYPRLYNNAEEMLKKKINEGIIKRKINKFDTEKKNDYFKRIKEELEVYKICDAVDYILLQENITSWARKNGIDPGPGRGSVTGSEIAYALGITDMDSIKHNLNFFRFLNPHRISLSDIDVDYPSSRRSEIIDYVANMEGIYFSEIVTFNTIADKGAIRDTGRALNIPLSEVDEISKNYEGNEDKYRRKYHELFKYVDLLKGVNVSVGSHPSGFLCSPINIEESIGTFTTSTCRYPISCCDMKAVDSINYVKLDILGLDNVEIINETCKLANIERVTPDNVDIHNDEVWNSIKENGLSIFQMESKFAHDSLSRALESYNEIKKVNKDMTRIDLMSMVNGAIRPSGESFRDNLINGVFNDNGHPVLNNLLSKTQGFLVYQESIIQFLVEFCGFTPAEGDSVRRKIGKKLGTDDVIPEIKQRFIKTMKDKYNVPNEELEIIVEPFLKIISDASSYGFSINHSQAYSYIGYICGYLRHFYPLEFLTVVLNINNDNIDKTSEIIKYANLKNITIQPIKFRKSQASYSMDKETNSIFKGIESIKFMSSQVADELYVLKDNQYFSFIDLLIDVEKTSCNSRQMTTLITLNFFDEFYKNQKLLNIYNLFKKLYGKKQIKKDKISELGIEELTIQQYSRETPKTYLDVDMISILKEYEYNIKNEQMPILKQIIFEQENLGYCSLKLPQISNGAAVCVNLNTKYTPVVTVYYLKTGEEKKYKISKKLFKQENKTLEINDIVMITKTENRPKYKMTEGGFERVEGDYEPFISEYYKATEESLENYIKKLNNI
jgi:DNA polymerase-3 subunit alpha